MKTFQQLLTPLACAAALCLGLPTQAATLTGSANSPSVIVGEQAQVTLTLNLSDPIQLIGLTLTAEWSPGAFSVDPATTKVFGQSLANFESTLQPDLSTIDADDHHLGIVMAKLPPSPINLVSMPYTIELSLLALSTGVQTLHYSVELADPSVLAEPFPLPASTSFDATITVSAVPEPSPAALLLAGVAVLGLLSRRKLG